MASDRQTEFRELFARFCTEYFSTSAGEKHRATYGASAESALRNLKNIRDAELAGRSTTDLVLDGLLPHLDTRSTRERGAWIHVAPAINSDVRTWYEYDGFVKPEDWKHVAKEILLFITTAYDRPAKLSHAVATFVASQYSRGFQTGMLTPVLHALRPNEFVLINGKSYPVVNYFTEASILPQIADYPRANEVTWKWLRDCEPVMRELTTDLTTPVSVIFDMFCHWMVAIAKAIEAKGRRSLRLDVTPAKPLVAPQLNRRIWSFSAGPGGSEWPLFRSEAVVAIDWAGLGDLRDYVSKDEINAKLLQLFPGPVTKLNDSHACWQFVHEMAVGDIIVAKHGRQRVLAIGEVAGEYQFVEGASSYQHRRSVKWLNIGPWTLPDSALMAVNTLTDVTDYTSFIETIRRIVHFDFGESTSLDDDDDGDHVIVSQHQAARYTIQDALADC